MKLDNKTYDVLKWIAQILLPAIGTLYFALSKIWGLPFSTEIVGTISAVDVFLGALLLTAVTGLPSLRVVMKLMQGTSLMVAQTVVPTGKRPATTSRSRDPWQPAPALPTAKLGELSTHTSPQTLTTW